MSINPTKLRPAPKLWLALLAMPLLAGCAGERASRATERPNFNRSVPTAAVESSVGIQLTASEALESQEPEGKQLPRPVPVVNPDGLASNENPFVSQTELAASQVIRMVLERNPTIEQMRAAATAAQARYPQAISLDDPLFGFATAPGSIGSTNAGYAGRAELSQKFPYPGKRFLRGQVVQREANAAVQDVDDVRLQLIEAAWSAYADYFLTERALALNDENLKRARELRQNAATRVKNAQAPQQDILQADVEIARLQERTVILERARQVSKARLNTLMHYPPDAFLPVPQRGAAQLTIPAAQDLRARALLARPDAKALVERVASEEAAVALAQREYKPDVELLAAYDSFWQGSEGRPLQWQVGARINLPVRLSRRSGAVIEAQAGVATRRADLSRLSDQIGLQVQEAYELAQENIKVLSLYDKTLIPAAEANIKEAIASYATGKVPFVALVEAQRNLINLKDRHAELLAESLRRKAALERAVGGPIDEKK